MAVNADSIPHTGAPPKRRLRNYLLDTRFQLKYTGMVVAVTVVVAGVLGFFAYNYSRGQTEMLTAQKLIEGGFEGQTIDMIEAEARAEDRRVLLGILGGILVMGLSIGATGIVVTHKLVGPAYKLKRLFREVADGHLKVGAKLRKGDELQDVFESFEKMIETLRRKQAEEVRHLDDAIERAKAAGCSTEVLNELGGVRDRMQRELD